MADKNHTPSIRKPARSFEKFSEKTFLTDKLNNWPGYLLFSLFAVGMGYLMARQTILGMGLTGLIVGSALLFVCLLSTEAGLYTNMIYAFFANHLNRLFFYGQLQIGVFSDILILVTLLSLVIRRTHFKQSLNHFTQFPAVVVLLLIYCYMAIELFNPNAFSFNGWFQAFRKILGTLFLLFISFNLFDSYARIKRYLTVLFALCIIVALYGCIQQWHGLFEFELDWVMADHHLFGLMFIDGEFRKMSTMSDPPSFAIVMAVCSVLFIALANGKKKPRTKIILLTGVLFMIIGGSYSGIRTANAMLIAGLVMFILLTLNRKSTRLLAVIATFFFLALMYGPFDNLSVQHFRATFSGTKDDSYNVRETNRKSVQPYIYTHPIGGGLGTTGGEGMTFNPGHYLAGFPPDSGYLKKALEIGWIGFTMICILYFLILRTGIEGYFATKDETIRLIYAGVTSAMFCFYVGDFSQEAIGQLTDVVIYYPFVAILLRLKEFDQSKKTVTA